MDAPFILACGWFSVSSFAVYYSLALLTCPPDVILWWMRLGFAFLILSLMIILALQVLTRISGRLTLLKGSLPRMAFCWFCKFRSQYVFIVFFFFLSSSMLLLPSLVLCSLSFSLLSLKCDILICYLLMKQ